MRIEGNPTDGNNLPVKRFRLNGIIIYDNCPACGEEVTRDLGTHYLSYPVLNTPMETHMIHEPCPEAPDGYREWPIEIIMDLSIRPTAN